MVYASPASLSDENNNLSFFSNNAPNNTDPVQVFYNGTGLHSICGPVPLVDIAKTYNRTEGGILQSTLNRININGKILRIGNESNVTPAGTGTQKILEAVSGLDKLFKCDNGVFEIKCAGNILFFGSGVKVLSFNANKSSDNWIFSADYNIDLEFYEPAITGSSYSLIKKGSDSWSLEPIEDYIYSDFQITVKQRAEKHNPKLQPTALLNNAGSSTQVPTNDGDTQNLRILNIPQYKLSRRISAEGIPVATGNASGNCGLQDNYSAYINAKKWVESRLSQPFNGTGGSSAGTSPSGLPRFHNSVPTTINSIDKIYLYNHLRSINFDHLAGSYEVNETWLAMPTGIRYVEDYTVETSTDDRYIRTVRVQGNIKGLMIAQLPIMSGTTSSGLIPATGDSAVIDLKSFMSPGYSGALYDTMKISDINQNSLDNIFYPNKYTNAASGWLNDIKPYVYRRACLGVNSSERNRDLIDRTASPQPAPGNPIYSNERHLNIIPISTSENHDPRKGTISYSYEFNNRLKILTGVISENISITDTGPIDVINQAFVLGRRLGPVIQSLGTRTNATKSVVIDIVVVPPTSIKDCLITSSGCPVWTGGTTYKTITDMIEGFKPFGDRVSHVFGNVGDMVRTGTNTPQGQVYATENNHSWNPTEGRFVRTVSWVYQTCDTSRFYLDH